MAQGFVLRHLILPSETEPGEGWLAERKAEARSTFARFIQILRILISVL